MLPQSNKIGFWSVVALITACQVDAGAFLLPANLAPYGMLWIGGWAIACLGAIALSLVFARLGSWFPQTGGPYIFVAEAFGSVAAFFTGWTYWIVSWVSTTVIIIASIGYIIPLIGIDSKLSVLGMEIALIIIITLFNFRGVKASGNAEVFLSALRIIPLIIVPIAALFFFNKNNIAIAPSVTSIPMPEMLSHVVMLIIWGFMGMESATVAAGSIDNPKRTIPLAILFSTVCVSCIYLINGLGITGIIPHSKLVLTTAPYTDAVYELLGRNFHISMSLLTSVMCITSLNAWTLTSGQMTLGLAKSKILPAFFARKNKYNAPIWGLSISCIGSIFCLCLTTHERLAQQMITIIDFSVIGFLFVYTICCLAFLKLIFQRYPIKKMLLPFVYGSAALSFCCWVMYQTDITILLIPFVFAITGIPFYLYHRKTNTPS
jgi:APA family basic amino acid/polyamine antiporter